MDVRPGGAAWLALVSLLVVAGCSAAQETSPEPGSPEPGSAEELPLRGPLEEHIAWGEVDGAAAFVEGMKLEASRTAVCMSRLGFEYYPAIPAAEDVEEAAGPEWGGREFTERYGYGAWNEIDEMVKSRVVV